MLTEPEIEFAGLRDRPIGKVRDLHHVEQSELIEQYLHSPDQVLRRAFVRDEDRSRSQVPLICAYQPAIELCRRLRDAITESADLGPDGQRLRTTCQHPP